MSPPETKAISFRSGDSAGSVKYGCDLTSAAALCIAAWPKLMLFKLSTMHNKPTTITDHFRRRAIFGSLQQKSNFRTERKRRTLKYRSKRRENRYNFASAGTIANARTGNVPNFRTFTGTEKNLNPSLGSSRNPHKCSTIGM